MCEGFNKRLCRAGARRSQVNPAEDCSAPGKKEMIAGEPPVLRKYTGKQKKDDAEQGLGDPRRVPQRTAMRPGRENEKLKTNRRAAGAPVLSRSRERLLKKNYFSGKNFWTVSSEGGCVAIEPMNMAIADARNMNVTGMTPMIRFVCSENLSK